jgi:hypothetical protein
MNPMSVSVSIRYSKTMQDGSHKTVELSVEGDLSNNEPWKEVQASLYKELGEQMRYVFASNKGVTCNAPTGTNGKSHAEIPPAQATTTREHWCATHQAEFQRFTKGNQTWYSHRGPDGTWCKEPNK